MSAEALAELREVRKSFGAVRALAGVSLEIHAGEIVSLLGPNGAGKTTAVQTLLGLRRPDSGEALLLGRNPRDPHARASCGSTPQETDLPPTLRVEEIVDLVRFHYRRPASRKELLARFGLLELGHRQAGGLSGGQRRRVAVALAFAGDPRLVCLDEPSSGLDREARRALWAAIRSFAASGRSILLTTHDLAEAEALATRVVVLARGQVQLEGAVDQIRARAGHTRILVPRQRLPPLRHTESSTVGETTLTLLTRDPGALMRELVGLRADLSRLEVTPLSLEEALDAGEAP